MNLPLSPQTILELQGLYRVIFDFEMEDGFYPIVGRYVIEADSLDDALNKANEMIPKVFNRINPDEEACPTSAADIKPTIMNLASWLDIELRKTDRLKEVPDAVSD